MKKIFLCFLIVVVYFSSSSNLFAGKTDGEVKKEFKSDLIVFGLGIAEAYRGIGKRSAPKEIPEKEKGYAKTVIIEIGKGYEIKWVKRPSDTDVSFPETLQVSKKGLRLPGEIKIGTSTRAKIIALCGPPISENKESISYYIPGYCGDDLIVFNLKDNVLQSVLWEWFID